VPSPVASCVVVTDKGYSRKRLKALEDSMWKTCIAGGEPAKLIFDGRKH
jgi:hypothetical protein